MYAYFRTGKKIKELENGFQAHLESEQSFPYHNHKLEGQDASNRGPTGGYPAHQSAIHCTSMFFCLVVTHIYSNCKVFKTDFFFEKKKDQANPVPREESSMQREHSTTFEDAYTLKKTVRLFRLRSVNLCILTVARARVACCKRETTAFEQLAINDLGTCHRQTVRPHRRHRSAITVCDSPVCMCT